MTLYYYNSELMWDCFVTQSSEDSEHRIYKSRNKQSLFPNFANLGKHDPENILNYMQKNKVYTDSLYCI